MTLKTNARYFLCVLCIGGDSTAIVIPFKIIIIIYTMSILEQEYVYNTYNVIILTVMCLMPRVLYTGNITII